MTHKYLIRLKHWIICSKCAHRLVIYYIIQKDIYFLTDFGFFGLTWDAPSVVFLAQFLYVLTYLTSSSAVIGACTSAWCIFSAIMLRMLTWAHAVVFFTLFLYVRTDLNLSSTIIGAYSSAWCISSEIMLLLFLNSFISILTRRLNCLSLLKTNLR